MSQPTQHLAQLNIGRLRYDLDDPRLADFIDNLARVNAIAERSEGFVWRLKDETGNATNIRAFEDPRMTVNMSVWESVEALEKYVWQTVHKRFYGRRSEWFEHLDPPLSRDVVGSGRAPADHRGSSRKARSPAGTRAERARVRVGRHRRRPTVEDGALRLTDRRMNR